MHRQPYDEVAEVTLPPMQELLLSVVLGPSAFRGRDPFFLAGLFAPVEMARHGVSGSMRLRLLRLGGPWVLFTVLVWPLFTWFRLRDTFTVLVRHLLRQVQRNDLLCLRAPSRRDRRGGAGAGAVSQLPASRAVVEHCGHRADGSARSAGTFLIVEERDDIGHQPGRGDKAVAQLGIHDQPPWGIRYAVSATISKGQKPSFAP